MRTLAMLAFLAGLFLGCGTRTGLRVPDAALSTRSDAYQQGDVLPRPPTDIVVQERCMPGTFSLERKAVELLFLIDRSASMNSGIEQRSIPPSRWQVLIEGLEAVLPRLTAQFSVGMLLFPQPFAVNGEICAVDQQLAIDFATNNTSEALTFLTAQIPEGPTPTFAAVRNAQQVLLARRSRSVFQAVLLATDGGPNCNETLDSTSCRCSDGEPVNMSSCIARARNCLDDVRTTEAIRTLHGHGIPTFVFGIEDRGNMYFPSVMAALAHAGGRPSPDSASGYYSIRSIAQLRDALLSIERQLNRCVYVLPSAPSQPAGLEVSIDGALVPQDARNGWQFSAPWELSFLGSACESLQSGAEPTAVVTCAR